MNKETGIKKYTWDMAISLCKQDIEFARKLVRALNPSLKVFFYENKQEELISKSGPEMFAKTFKEQSRLVVILSRKEWSESYYTEIERNAIIDRTAVKNEGYQFLMIFPMVKDEVPIWYPSTRIYADPYRFTIEELARFIEFKLTEEGGSIKPITVEDRYQHLLNRIEEKKLIIKLQQDAEAIQIAKDEILIIKDCFNNKSEFLRKSGFGSVSWLNFNEFANDAYLGIGEYLLECEILLPDEMYHRIVTTQDFCVSFNLYKIFGSEENRKLLEHENRLFYYTQQLKGWSLPHLFEQASIKEKLVLFQNRENHFYDLINPINTSEFIDNWFQKFLKISTQAIERYI